MQGSSQNMHARTCTIAFPDGSMLNLHVRQALCSRHGAGR